MKEKGEMMFKLKQTSPAWILFLYPYWWLLRYQPKLFFKVLTGRGNWGWHYLWEKKQALDREEARSLDNNAPKK